MKTLVIYPDSNTHRDSTFHLFDPETGDCLASHLCSGSWWAQSDLHDRREDRLKEWKERFGEETQAKFIDQTDYDWDEIYKKNQELAKKVKEENKINKIN